MVPIFRKTHKAVNLTSCLASLAITTLVLYAAFPVSRTEMCYDLSSNPITSFTERGILHVHVCSLGLLLCVFPANVGKSTKVIGKVWVTHYPPCSSQNADTYLRYSNTLLVSFNNRIYFREHQLPEHGDSACLTVSGRVRATALSSLGFAVPGPQSRTPTVDNFQLCAIVQTVELDKGKGDDTSINWSPVSRISRYTCYQRF